MSAKDTLRRNKTDIQTALCGDFRLILNKVQEKNLITDRDYHNLKSINREDVEGHVVELVDKIMNKGEETCQDFLSLLQTDEDIKTTYPELKDIQWNNTSFLPKPVQASSVEPNNVLLQESTRQNEVMALPPAKIVHQIMIDSRERSGMSALAIGKALATYTDNKKPCVKTTLNKMMAKGTLVQTQGIGASSFFKMNKKAVEKKEPAKKAAPKTNQPKTPAAAKKSQLKLKIPAAMKVPKMKVPKKAPAATKVPKMKVPKKAPAAMKVPKMKVPKKVPAAKKAPKIKVPKKAPAAKKAPKIKVPKKAPAAKKAPKMKVAKPKAKKAAPRKK